ncbi:YwqG family protein [uncultured Selenomonas sp.]|uniref:YwqG family protein n=1 Tax=uncultured Selenomonas sp. TaxID=159275 RepID=UPI002674B826|nr:YwqG family protein [uncultured Selenomonas sp.]
MKTAQEYIEERSFFDAVKVLYEVPEAERDALWNYRMGYALYFFAVNRYPKLCVLRLALGYLERADEDAESKAEIERVFYGKPGGMTARCQEAVENKHGWYAEEPVSMSVEQLVREAEAERERVRREVTAFFERTQRREIAISHHPAQEKLPIGASKFYGTPDLPTDFDWPYYKGTDFEGVTKNRPLAFLAQINLGEAAPYDRTGLLPKTGVLSFFYETVSMEWGFELKSEGYARVYYFPETEGLVPTKIPEETKKWSVGEQALTFADAVSLLSSFAYSRSCGKEVDWDTYNELRAEFGCDAAAHRDNPMKMLGYADEIQGEMEPECELYSRDIEGDVQEELSEEEEAELVRNAADHWVLLFQMGTVEDDETELMYGDCGLIYFWIRKEDLAARNFHRVRLILQCG